MTESAFVHQPKQVSITITEKAIKHINRQIEREGHGIGLRLGIRKSGCSGYAYDVKIIDELAEDDQVFPTDTAIKLAVSRKHLPILQGTEIDYIQDGLNYRFQFNNPNETASCGCGESFTVNEE